MATPYKRSGKPMTFRGTFSHPISIYENHYGEEFCEFAVRDEEHDDNNLLICVVAADVAIENEFEQIHDYTGVTMKGKMLDNGVMFVEELEFAPPEDSDKYDEYYNYYEDMKSKDVPAEELPERIVSALGLTFKLDENGQYIPDIEYTSDEDEDEEEQELLGKPIGRWGAMWQRWIERQYPQRVEVYKYHGTWGIIPRVIDIEAEERWDTLDKIYREYHKRPNGEDFFELSRWEKERLLYIDHIVMREVVYALRPYRVTIQDAENK